MNNATTWTMAIAMLASVSAVQAHHAGSMYEQSPIWIKGTVVGFDRTNPHSIITLEDRSADGQVRRWAVEGPAQFQLDRMGFAEDFPRVGDVLQFCSFPYKPEHLARFRSQDPDGVPRQLIEGHVMVMPDGAKQFWDPHGIIGACIQSSDDSRKSWLEFLNSNPRAREAWCQQRGSQATQSTTSSRELVDEIDRWIDKPCQ
jgi:Family of unknown function (DUF6152)